MRKNTRTPILAALMGLAAAAVPAWEGHPEAPEELKHVEAGGESLTLWPYTTSDFDNPSDPINLVFPNADPRAIRQELLKLDGNRPPFASLPWGGCRWTDAMGYEQAAYAEPAGWVGSAVQLACVPPGAPLGSPFRFHIRLFRSGEHTLGGAHFEVLIPGTAEHEVLSWDHARDFATYDLLRTGARAIAPVGLIPGGSFRTVRKPVYDGLVQGGAGPLLGFLRLAVSSTGEIPIPTSGAANVLLSEIDFEPCASKTTTTTRVGYSIIVPKPFCAEGPYDLVKLEGPLDFSMTVRTYRSGRYDRSYLVGGNLKVTPMMPTSATIFVPTGEPVDALIFETHGGTLTDRQGQVTERAAQVLLGDPRQSLSWHFAAGQADHFARKILCGTD